MLSSPLHPCRFHISVQVCIAVGFSLLACAPAWADPAVHQSKVYAGPTLPRVEGAASRSCGPSDMVGIWQLVGYGSRRDLRHTDVPYAYPYQVFRFEVDGTMRSAHSRTAFVETPAQVLTRVPGDLSYELVPTGKGMLTVASHGQADPAETWYCRTLTIDQVDLVHRTVLRRGDVVLTLVGKTGEPLFTRHLRKF